MRERIASLLIVLSLGTYGCAQEGTVEHCWTNKNNTEMYAAYMLRVAYNEQGYWETKVEIRQAGTKRVFVVQPGRIYHVGRFSVSGRGDLPEEAMMGSSRSDTKLRIIASKFSPVGGPGGLKTRAHWQQPQPRKRGWSLHTSSRAMASLYGSGVLGEKLEVQYPDCALPN